ncbi:formate C-acetyltransferase [Acidaminobacter sp. JC074]|uniref:formate C-acetyltransferase n=1 Tax=Acidaminobacter sp. JC074 TaxID=2530199 RepID=UPI001F117AE6|nr:formate C-acetyltransferase [Acidaminobacter sp. JC074]
MNSYRSFKGTKWQEAIDVRNFIQENYTPYYGDESFLESPTERTKNLFDQVTSLMKKELEKGGVLDIDLERVSSLLTYEPGYIDADKELILGLQTDKPLKRGVNPFGGIRMARQACESYGYKLSEKVEEHFEYKTTHNDGVFRVYSDETKKLRSAGILTGLPDAYGRGRIIGDYRRVALYGIDKLIEEKRNDKRNLSKSPMTEETIRLIEEVYKQIDFLKKLIQMAEAYGHDISIPAKNAHEAIQWTYYGYLAAIKEQNGAAMSLGRVSTFFDIYIQRDIEEGLITESQAQEYMDDFVIKLRMARQLRTPEYNELFAGDPLWITESLGGIGLDGRPLVSKTTYRFLHTLTNLGPAPEPNMTVLWSKSLPESFKAYCSKLSIETDAIQYENDDLMRSSYGDDYGIACCVSAMAIGKEMQFFGARCNLAKTLLLALNNGKDEVSGKQVAPGFSHDFSYGYLDYDAVKQAFDKMLSWICKEYVNAMNIIHYMHDKYAYEKTQMALHDTHVKRNMAFGIAGLSVVSDALSAIKYAKVKPIYSEDGMIVDYIIEGDFPKFGNDDDRVDSIASELTDQFISELRKHETYRKAKQTLSILTITSNVVYGKKTGNTPDGRKSGQAFAPGANPMHNREEMGAIASLNSVAKLPYESCEDGISCTFSIEPKTLGREELDRVDNLVSVLDGYFSKKAHHVNVNVISKEKLIEAIEKPEKYPNLTIRVSGYAVNFHRLTHAQKLEVIGRTYHEKI